MFERFAYRYWSYEISFRCPDSKASIECRVSHTIMSLAVMLARVDTSGRTKSPLASYHCMYRCSNAVRLLSSLRIRNINTYSSIHLTYSLYPIFCLIRLMSALLLIFSLIIVALIKVSYPNINTKPPAPFVIVPSPHTEQVILGWCHLHQLCSSSILSLSWD